MSSLPKEWIIKDYKHALRIIKSFVEQGGEVIKGATTGPWHWIAEDESVVALYGPKDEYDHVLWSQICPACAKRGNRCTSPSKENSDFIAKSRSLIPALVEGAKSILDEWESYGARDDDKTHEFTQGIEFELRNFTIRQARAFAPRMAEAGMTVPK